MIDIIVSSNKIGKTWGKLQGVYRSYQRMAMAQFSLNLVPSRVSFRCAAQTWSQGHDFQGQGQGLGSQGQGQGRGLDSQGQSQNLGLIYFIYAWSRKCIAYIMHNMITYIEFCSEYSKDNKLMFCRLNCHCVNG